MKGQVQLHLVASKLLWMLLKMLFTDQQVTQCKDIFTISVLTGI